MIIKKIRTIKRVKNNTRDINSNPLWMPEGSVRALLALSMTFCMLFLVILKIEVPDFLALAFGVVITHYFENRKQEADRKERMENDFVYQISNSNSDLDLDLKSDLNLDSI